MKLLELPLGRASNVYELKLPANARIVGVGISHRDDAPALLIQSDFDPGQDGSEMVAKEFAVLCTADQMPDKLAQRLEAGQPHRLIGTISLPDTPSWVVFLVTKPDQDMRS